jgi:hypothetical protein
MAHPSACGRGIEAGKGFARNAAQHGGTALIRRRLKSGNLHRAANAQAIFHRRHEHLAIRQDHGARHHVTRALELQVVTALAFKGQVHAQRRQQFTRPSARRDDHLVIHILNTLPQQFPAALRGRQR